MVESITVLRPLFDEIEMLIPGDSSNISHLLTKRKILIGYRNDEKNDVIEAVQQTWVGVQGCYVHTFTVRMF